MFGTFEVEGEKVRYGITKNVGTYYLPKVIFHEWQTIVSDVKKADTLGDKWRYMFGRVGWNQAEKPTEPDSKE